MFSFSNNQHKDKRGLQQTAPLYQSLFRTCSHRRGVRIFEHNFADDKANFRRRAVARQENSTQSSGKICRKDARLSYENMFLN